MAEHARLEVAIETSRHETSLALRRGDELFEDEPGARPHASDLLARFEDLLRRAGVSAPPPPLPLRAVFVGLGPGSYTGLRIGLATAQALARGAGALLFGIPSFEALVFQELAEGEQGEVLRDARAGRFYHGRYLRTADGVRVLEPAAAVEAAALAPRLRGAGPLLGDPGLAEAADLAPAQAARLRPDPPPRAAAVLRLGLAREAAGELLPAQSLEPLYLARFGTAPAGTGRR